ncbi:MAG: imidazole glycerol phosphate synthase subunit HisH [Dysgonamonadaceae bacterium]|jgi:glutamine amidotransferase|nr:imidazole glycerol phosphate synthase subunit HisH [Dysgonamonadaceae bacterium]
MTVAVVKYNAGNLCSVDYALKRLNVNAVITDDAEMLQRAGKVIFPGVGEAKNTMEYLRQHRLDQVIKDLKQPVLGICLGMQLMCRHSEEGDVDCLGIFDLPVLKFQPQKHEDKVPHTGWNMLAQLKGDLYKNVPEESFAYYVHSYYVPVNNFTTAQTDYIQLFSASIQKDNFYAAQFHPEKSGAAGEKILHNFLQLK